MKNVVRWSEGPVMNNVSPVLVEFKEEKDRCFIIIMVTIVIIIKQEWCEHQLQGGDDEEGNDVARTKALIMILDIVR